MDIWVDADACPKMIKDILFRAAQRTQTQCILVANQPLRHPTSEYISFILVGAGFDVADDEIVRLIQKDDLVVTADIPLAAEAIEKGALALNPRGELYTTETIKQRLTMRDFMDTMRGSGIETEGPPPFSAKHKQLFANNLDRLLCKAAKENKCHVVIGVNERASNSVATLFNTNVIIDSNGKIGKLFNTCSILNDSFFDCFLVAP